MRQRARFTPPTSAPAGREREVTFGVAGGLHAGVPSQDVPPGFSPDLRNLELDATFATPRSGLSQFQAHNTGGVVLGSAEAFDVVGNLGGVYSTASRVRFLHPTNAVWSNLSYLPGSHTTWSNGALSGTSTDYVEFETIFSADRERMLTVFSNNTQMAKYFEFAASAITHSDFTWIDSISSTKAFKDIASINARLVMFNLVSSTGTRWPTRVMWSARGNPLSYLVADGAGAEDLKDMQGSGQAIVRWRDFLLLFTELEIWRATPTLDDYAFRFDRVIDQMGTPFPRTIATTPFGVVFVGRDFEVYATDGANLIPLGPVGGEGASRVQAKIRAEISGGQRMWALYNQSKKRYELYYAASDSPQGFPTRALWFDFTTKTWWTQRFSHSLSDGVEIVDPATQVTWDDIEDSWDATVVGWDSFDVATGAKSVNVFAAASGVTSATSTLKFFSTHTSDDGVAIDVRWRSRGLKNGMRKGHLKDVWVDYEVDSASSASMWVGSARSGSVFTSEAALDLATTNRPLFVPLFSTDNAPAFELRLNDGGRPKIASFTATLQDASKF